MVASGLISATAAIIVAAISNNSTKKLIEYKLDELTKRVDNHNGVIDRTYKLEQDTAVQEEKITVANKRIKDLESLFKEWDGVERRAKA